MTDEGLFRALDGRNAYEVLGVPRGATRDEIIRAKRERQREAHPDLHGGGTGDAMSKLINNAAAILSDDRIRADYDRWSSRGSPVPPPAAPSAWDAGTPGFTEPARAPGPYQPGFGHAPIGRPPAGAPPPGPFPPGPPPNASAAPAWAGPEMPGASIPTGPMAMPGYRPAPSRTSSGPGAPAIVGLIILCLLVLCCGPVLCAPFLQR